MPSVTKPITTINLMYKQGLAAMAKEMERILTFTAGDKLSLGHAKDLRDYVKLLAEMKKAYEAIEADKKKKRDAASSAASEETLKKSILENI